MRILVFSDIPPYVTGGAEQQSSLLIKEWVKLGHNVVCMGHRIPNDNWNGVELVKIPVLYKMGRAIRALTFFVSLFFNVFSRRKNIDIIYCRFLGESIICLSLLKKLKIINIPLVCVPAAAGNSDNADAALINSLPFSVFLKKTISEQCDCINFISPGIKQSIIDLGVIPRLHFEVPNGVAFSDGFFERDFSSPVKLLFVGRLVHQKGVDILLRALKRVNLKNGGFICRIVGDGLEMGQLKKIVVGTEIESNVEFVGALTNDQVRAELAGAHFFVLPSRYEGLSNSALEAMSSGVPCILTRCNGLDALLPEDLFFLSESNSDVALSRTLESAFSISDHEWTALSRGSYEFSKNNYSIKSVALRNIEIFNSLLK